jgi:hypothetical protein
LYYLPFLPSRTDFIHTWSWVTSERCRWRRLHKCCRTLIKSKKVKLSLCLTKNPAMKTYWGSGGRARIFDLGTRWMWVVSFTPRPLHPQGKSPRYPLNRRLGGPQSRSLILNLI